MSTEAQKRTVAKYNALHTKQYNLRLNIHTDADVIARLESVDSKRGYIIKLIRKDIENNL